jgi:competence protein ComEA
MMKKLLITLFALATYAFASINLQTASKEQLMSISGIGAKKAEAIMKYRKTHKLKSADDLLKVKGIGKGIVSNVKGNVKGKKLKNMKQKAKSKKQSLTNKKDKMNKKAKNMKSKMSKKEMKKMKKAKKNKLKTDLKNKSSKINKF